MGRPGLDALARWARSFLGSDHIEVRWAHRGGGGNGRGGLACRLKRGERVHVHDAIADQPLVICVLPGSTMWDIQSCCRALPTLPRPYRSQSWCVERSLRVVRAALDAAIEGECYHMTHWHVSPLTALIRVGLSVADYLELVRTPSAGCPCARPYRDHGDGRWKRRTNHAWITRCSVCGGWPGLYGSEVRDDSAEGACRSCRRLIARADRAFRKWRRDVEPERRRLVADDIRRRQFNRDRREIGATLRSIGALIKGSNVEGAHP